jgi:uncharacterized membrane protein (DUF485 family)
MKSLLALMYRPRTEGFWPYVTAVALIAYAGSLTVVLVVNYFTGWLGPDVEGPSLAVSWGAFFRVVVFAPIVETALLLVTLRVIQKARFSPGTSAGLAALVWGGLHALLYPPWFFGTVWSFFVFACAVLAWRGKSRKHAYWAAALPHALVNMGVFGTLASTSGA